MCIKLLTTVINSQPCCTCNLFTQEAQYQCEDFIKFLDVCLSQTDQNSLSHRHTLHG